MKLKALALLSTLLIGFVGTTFAKTTNDTIKSLTFATEATYPPFETVAPSGQLQGFDIDVANAICGKLKTKCNFINQPFNSLIVNLQLGKFDAIIAAMAITPAREKAMSFTTPYYIDTISFIAPKNATFDTTPGKLKNKIVGVQQGTTFATYLATTYGKDVTVKTYASEETAVLDLQSGRIDAVMGDTPLLAIWLREHGNGKYHFVGKPIEDQKLLGKGFGIAVNKTNTKLLKSLNTAITELQHDGTLKKIVAKYFSSSK